MRPDVKTPEIGGGYADVVMDLYKDSKPMRGEIHLMKYSLYNWKFQSCGTGF
ncbi:hypothetical protein [Acinetobacter chinensis]|uniref:hypothetical protein n=1 Tax=Acinetobacter chinensis TaxID=2004650 RepID=UPI0029344F15|nr:hypothetical protein [Acinetobacter chinensis]WOE42856.1 hypothetical protein QSG87_06960 [Acinetobacter chinensis]